MQNRRRELGSLHTDTQLSSKNELPLTFPALYPISFHHPSSRTAIFATICVALLPQHTASLHILTGVFRCTMLLLTCIVIILHLAHVHAREASVRDLVECLGNKTRYRIVRDGTAEILVTSSPHEWTYWQQQQQISQQGDFGEWNDEHVSDCIVKLGLFGAVAYQVAPLEFLHPTVSTAAMEGEEAEAVSLDFIPTQQCDYFWCDKKQDPMQEKEGDNIRQVNWAT